MVPPNCYCSACGAANQAHDAFCFACGRSLPATTPSPQYPMAGSGNNTPTSLPPPNLILKQRYHIASQVGKGGFGAVYKAEDIQLGNRLLAVKEMSQWGLNPQEIIEATDAFKREAHMLAGLKHPNLPSIYDYFNELGRWYLVMDFIEGETLEEHLNKEKEGHLPYEEVLQIGIQLCTVLGYLHTRQPPIIFRDLKPTNIMLITDGQLYLIDFGIARHFKPEQTKDTIAFGSPGYAAPEQYGKTQSTPRADIYSLGVTLHQLLTGSDPSDTPFQFAPLQLQGQPTPPGLEPLITQMLDMNKDKRPASMFVVKQELQRIATQKSVSPLSSPLPLTQPNISSAFQTTKKPWLDVVKQELQRIATRKSVSPLSSPLPLTQPNVSGAFQTTKKPWLDTGNDLYKAKRYREALYACEQALQLDPNSASIYNLKGNVLCDLMCYKDALTAFERAIQLDSNSATAFKNKGFILDKLMCYQEALAAYEQALQLDPKSAVAHASRGSILFTLKRYQEALAAYEQALRLDPSNADFYNNKGRMLQDLKRYELALTSLEQALRLDPNLASAYYNKGRALDHLGRGREAKQAYDRAKQLGYARIIL